MRRQPLGGPTGSGSVHGFDQQLWRLFFMVELAVSAAVVGCAFVAAGRALTDLWPGVVFCYGFVLAVIVDHVVKRKFLRRQPLFSPVFSVMIGVFFVAVGAGLSWLMAR